MFSFAMEQQRNSNTNPLMLDEKGARALLDLGQLQEQQGFATKVQLILTHELTKPLSGW